MRIFVSIIAEFTDCATGFVGDFSMSVVLMKYSELIPKWIMDCPDDEMSKREGGEGVKIQKY